MTLTRWFLQLFRTLNIAHGNKTVCTRCSGTDLDRRHISRFITSPVCLSPDTTLSFSPQAISSKSPDVTGPTFKTLISLSLRMPSNRYKQMCVRSVGMAVLIVHVCSLLRARCLSVPLLQATKTSCDARSSSHGFSVFLQLSWGRVVSEHQRTERRSHFRWCRIGKLQSASQCAHTHPLIRIQMRSCHKQPTHTDPLPLWRPVSDGGSFL